MTTSTFLGPFGPWCSGQTCSIKIVEPPTLWVFFTTRCSKLNVATRRGPHLSEWEIAWDTNSDIQSSSLCHHAETFADEHGAWMHIAPLSVISVVLEGCSQSLLRKWVAQKHLLAPGERALLHSEGGGDWSSQSSPAFRPRFVQGPPSAATLPCSSSVFALLPSSRPPWPSPCKLFKGGFVGEARIQECAVASVCREAGVRVSTNVLLRELDLLGITAQEQRRIEVIAEGLPAFHRAKLAADLSSRSFTQMASHRRCPDESGVALEAAQLRKGANEPVGFWWRGSRQVGRSRGGRWPVL